VVALIREDYVARFGKRRHHGKVREIARRKIQRALRALERCEVAFDCRERVALAAHQARSSAAAAVALDRIHHPLLHKRMAGEQEIVVGREIQSSSWLESPRQIGEADFVQSALAARFERFESCRAKKGHRWFWRTARREAAADTSDPCCLKKNRA